MSKAQQLAEKLKQYIPNGDGYNSEFANDLAEAIEYLSQDEQPEQEPVAWMYEAPLAAGFSERTLSFGHEPEFEGKITPLYTQAKIDLAEQAVKPVAWWSGQKDTYILSDAEYQRHKANENFDGIKCLKPLYAHPPKLQPLSDDEIKNMWLMSAIFGTNLEKAVALTRAIEKAHRIR